MKKIVALFSMILCFAFQLEAQSPVTNIANVILNTGNAEVYLTSSVTTAPLFIKIGAASDVAGAKWSMAFNPIWVNTSNALSDTVTAYICRLYFQSDTGWVFIQTEDGNGNKDTASTYVDFRNDSTIFIKMMGGGGLIPPGGNILNRQFYYFDLIGKDTTNIEMMYNFTEWYVGQDSTLSKIHNVRVIDTRGNILITEPVVNELYINNLAYAYGSFIFDSLSAGRYYVVADIDSIPMANYTDTVVFDLGISTANSCNYSGWQETSAECWSPDWVGSIVDTSGLVNAEMDISNGWGISKVYFSAISQNSGVAYLESNTDSLLLAGSNIGTYQISSTNFQNYSEYYGTYFSQLNSWDPRNWISLSETIQNDMSGDTIYYRVSFLSILGGNLKSKIFKKVMFRTPEEQEYVMAIEPVQQYYPWGTFYSDCDTVFQELDYGFYGHGKLVQLSLNAVGNNWTTISGVDSLEVRLDSLNTQSIFLHQNTLLDRYELFTNPEWLVDSFTLHKVFVKNYLNKQIHFFVNFVQGVDTLNNATLIEGAGDYCGGYLIDYFSHIYGYDCSTPLPISSIELGGNTLSDEFNTLIPKITGTISYGTLVLEKLLNGNWVELTKISNMNKRIHDKPVSASYRLVFTDIDGKKFFSNEVKLTRETFFWEVYPNPAMNEITVVTSESSELIIYNMLGQKVLKQELRVNENRIDISNLTAGIYAVKVICDGNEYSQKIIKE